ncbi:hypothetical protein [Crocinitomix catalasitica]|uniref:hypothetical protein n=1 Tax=Crocinitomix catalasitica TaxID=184607 RepID=UPI000481BDCF|nr:hypothetical protein [Crocinitomix catalasitica]
MSSSDVFYGIADGAQWLFRNTLEPIGDSFWTITLIAGFLAFGYWMFRQNKFNNEAANNPDQRK